MGIARVPPTPNGYCIRQFQHGDEQAYDELFHLAFADEGRFPEILERSLDGGFFIVEHQESGHLVASCTAFRGSSSPRHREAGQLGWLVTDPAHTGKGLGTIVSALATNRLAREGYSQPFLGTEDARLPAISIYLKLGWRPYIYSGDTESRWKRIMAALGREFETIREWPPQGPHTAGSSSGL
jgi:mycothiol synthase